MQRDTSIDSFLKLDLSKTELERQKILVTLRKHASLPMCDREIAKETGLEVNIVESRRNDLDKRGVIIYSGARLYEPTQRMVRTWRAKL